jgi:hypothetical protein
MQAGQLHPVRGEGDQEEQAHEAQQRLHGACDSATKNYATKIPFVCFLCCLCCSASWALFISRVVL